MTTLEKAQKAVADAKDIAENYDLQDQHNFGKARDFSVLLTIANVQATIAQAEAMERIAEHLAGPVKPKVNPVDPVDPDDKRRDKAYA